MYLHRNQQISDQPCNIFIVTFPSTWFWNDFRRFCNHLYAEIENCGTKPTIVFDMRGIKRIPVGWLTALRVFIDKAPFDLQYIYVIGNDPSVNAAFTMVQQVDPTIGKRFVVFHTMEAFENTVKAQASSV